MNAVPNVRGHAPRDGGAPKGHAPRSAVGSFAPRPKFPDTTMVDRALDAIPKLILWKIASYEILRRLSPGEASKVLVVIANYWETYEILQAARDIETLLLIGPQRLVQGRLQGTQWDEGMRTVRMKMRELRQTLRSVAEEWQIVLDSVERSPVHPRAPMPERAEERGKPLRGAPAPPRKATLPAPTAPQAETAA